MMILLLRVLVAPVLVAGGSLAQRRWGQAIGGRLIGLPLTSIPLLALMDFSDGPHFAAQAATATLAGGMASSVWCLAYAVAARRWRPWAALGAATAAFALTALLLDHVALGTLAAAVTSSAFLLAALALWPAPRGETRPGVASRAELPLRMVVAAAFTFVLSSAAGSLGARPAGLVGSLPVLTIVLAVAAHRQAGGRATNTFLRGVLAGSWSLVASLTVLALLLPRHGAPAAFAAAVLAAVAVQVVASRPWHLSGASWRHHWRGPQAVTASTTE